MTNCKIEGSVNMHQSAIDEYEVSAIEDRKCLHRLKRQQEFPARQADY